MAGDERDVVPQRKQPLPDRGDQRIVIAPGKIGPADTSLEENIADERGGGLPMEKDDVPRRVAGTVDNVEAQIADRNRVAIGKPLVGLEGFGGRKTEHGCLLRKQVEPEAVVAMRPDNGDLVHRRQFRRRSYMIQVTMGEQDLIELHLLPFDGVAQTVDFAARVDQCGPAGTFTPEEGAVLLEWRDGKDFVSHPG